MNAVRTQPAARRKRRWIAEFGFVKYRFSKPPTRLPGACAHRSQGFCEPAIEPPDGDESLRTRKVHQLARLRVAGCHGLLDEQMFTPVQGQHSILVMQLRAAKNINDIDVRTLERRHTVATVLEKSELAPSDYRAFMLDVANRRQHDFSPVAQLRQNR